jgi:hypothetical protein
MRCLFVCEYRPPHSICLDATVIYCADLPLYSMEHSRSIYQTFAEKMATRSTLLLTVVLAAGLVTADECAACIQAVCAAGDALSRGAEPPAGGIITPTGLSLLQKG